MVILELVERMGALPEGASIQVRLGPGEADVVARWCERTGNQLVRVENDVAEVRRGRGRDPLAELPPERRPGARLWLYTNFDCNLACDYCCSASSPQTPRRALGLPRIRQIVAEAVPENVMEVFLTGGEPFLLLDLDQVVAACAAYFPTTVLTNGMLFRGRRLQVLRAMPRDRVALQISLDSPAPERHDRHRGAGSWARAAEGIRIARDEGFRVRVAATIAPGEAPETAALHAYLDDIGIQQDDRIIRSVARRGVADGGVELTTQTLLPEVTVTATGVYWHPVGADHLDQLVSPDIFPLSRAIDEVRRRFAAYHQTTQAAAESFPCA